MIAFPVTMAPCAHTEGQERGRRSFAHVHVCPWTITAPAQRGRCFNIPIVYSSGSVNASCRREITSILVNAAVARVTSPNDKQAPPVQKRFRQFDAAFLLFFFFLFRFILATHVPPKFLLSPFATVFDKFDSFSLGNLENWLSLGVDARPRYHSFINEFTIEFTP